MKNPEQVRRIELLSTIHGSLECAFGCMVTIDRPMTLALPSDHPAHRAYLDASVAIRTAQELVNQALEYCKK